MEDQHRQLVIRLPRPKLGTVLLLIVLAGLLAVATVIFTKRHTTDNSPFSAAITQQTGWRLYSPSKLPGGLSVRPDSAINSAGVVTFSIYSKNGNPLPVTEQARPKKFDFDKFYKQQFEISQQFRTDVGQATTGKFQGINVCSLVTNSTWIMVTAQDAAGAGQLPRVCHAFKLYNAAP